MAVTVAGPTAKLGGPVMPDSGLYGLYTNISAL